MVLEGARKPGAKILVSGGSRCNVTNAVVSDIDFWGGPHTIVRRILRGFSVDETIAFFRDIGIPLHEEPDGKLFPDSNRARDVLDALLRETSASGATLLSDHRVTSVERTEGEFRLVTPHGEIDAAAVVLATGGQSLPKSGSDGAGYGFAERLGHTIVATTPGLVPLTMGGQSGLYQELTGVSHHAEIAVWIDERVATRLRGSLLWTHFGISGPLALNASRHWLRARIEGRSAALTASFCPGSDFDAIDTLVRTAKSTIEAALTVSRGGLSTLPASAVRALAANVGIDATLPLTRLSREDRRTLVHALTAWPLAVSGTRGYNYAEVTAGGVALNEIDPATMESRVCPGLYLVGEVLDVDGRIGGFNFQWAWSSARAAARGLSR